MARVYDWNPVFSRQTGTQGEIAMVLGGKNIGKTFNLRRELIKRFLKTGDRYCEFSRSKDERDKISGGYMDKLQECGYFSGYAYKSSDSIGYIGKLELDEEGNDTVFEWMPFVYFVSLSTFQQEKKRTYSRVKYIFFDEFVIDRKDKYHRYLNNEVSIFINLVDTILREQYDAPLGAKIYLVGNSCDLLCPYFPGLGVRVLPEHGFSWHKNKQVILHNVEPWDIEQRQDNTLVGRMLDGNDEARMIFDNQFIENGDNFIEKKPSNAKYEFGIKYGPYSFGIWLDWSDALFYVTAKVPKNNKVYVLTKADATIDYTVVKRTDDLMQMMVNAFYNNLIRYDQAATREQFMALLGYFGVY